MKLFDKILLVALSGVAVLAGVILTMCAFGWGFHLDLSRGGTLFFCILALLLVLLSVRMFFVVFKKKAPDTGVQVQTSELGACYMTFEALEGVIRRQLSQQAEVKGVKVHLSMLAEDKLGIGLRITMLPDTPVAPFVSKIQQELKAYLESICGVKVGEIAVLVENAIAVDGSAPKAIASPRVK